MSEVYDNLNTARDKLYSLRDNTSMSDEGIFLGGCLSDVCEAVDDALDELDRLNARIKELENHLKPRSTRNEEYCEHHESREELGINHSDYGGEGMNHEHK